MVHEVVIIVVPQKTILSIDGRMAASILCFDLFIIQYLFEAYCAKIDNSLLQSYEKILKKKIKISSCFLALFFD